MSQLWQDAREMLHEQLEYRELLWQMTARDLLIRYKQTVMGFAWAVFMPLVNTTVFSVIFIRVAPLDTGMPYPLYAYTGLLAWNFFASSLRFAVNSLTGNVNLVTKIYFPREILPFSAILVSLVDFAVGSLVLVALMIYYGVAPGPSVVFLPVIIATQILFTAAVALVLAMANLFYRDVKYLFEVAITVWMFSTSVVFPVDRVGGTLGTLLALNPMTPIVDGYRAVLINHTWPGVPFAVASALSAVSFLVAWVLFHRAEFEFAENV